MDKTRTFSIITYGCQMNVADSEMIAGVLVKLGFSQIADFKKADLVLVNTCAVRVKPEEKVYGRMSALQHLKEKNPLVLIGLCGCLAQKEREKIVERAPFVDLVFGPQSIGELPELIAAAERSVNHKRAQMKRLKPNQKLKSRLRGAALMGNFENTGDTLPEKDVSRESDFKAYVTVMRGCDNFCSYCVVPYTRGREKSRPFETIVGEVEELVAAGYREITLLGQNVNSYNGGHGKAFPDLLRRLDRIDGKFYIRFLTSHPQDLSDDLIDAMATCPHVAPHAHLPVQSGSTDVLKAMNRRYSREHYLSLVDKMRSRIPHITLTTDIIAGFPGESDADFEDTLSLLEKVRFDSAFLFFYSEREGTAALALPGSLPVEVRLKRLDRLIEEQMRITFDVNRSMVGEIHEGIIEGFSPKNKKEFTVRTFDNHVVIVKAPDGGEPLKFGDFITMKITEGFNFVLKGEITSDFQGRSNAKLIMRP